MAKRAPTRKKSKTAKKTGKKSVKVKAKKTAKKVAKKVAKKAKKTAKKVAKVVKSKAKKATKATGKTKAAPKKAGKKVKAKTAAKAKPAAKAKAPAKAKVKATAAPKKRAPKVTAAPESSATETEVGTVPVVGDMAPEFSMQTDEGGHVALSDFIGRQPVILYFYPKADTPGCTKQSCDFRDGFPDFTAHGAQIIGVSPDPVSALQAFRAKYNLNFPLASDEGSAVATRYGVWVEKNNYGRTYMGIQRATFLIGSDGQIAAVWPKVSVEGHADEVLEALRSLESGDGGEESDEGEDGSDDEAPYGAH